MFHCRLVNPVHHDPALLLSLPQLAQRWLLDCGDLHALSLHELLQIDTVFVSHAHIDHWIGLDALMRAQLFGDRPLRVLGPKGILDMLAGRLAGYAWNLVSRSQFVVEGYEWTGTVWKSRHFPCSHRFVGREAASGLPALENWSLRWVELEHGVPCLGYRLESPISFRFREECPYPPGPWIATLKARMVAGTLEGTLLVAGEERPLSELRQWVRALPPEQLAYVTDTRLDPGTRARIVEAFGPTRVLWCEAAFLESQRALAESKLHSTATEAALLACELECERLQLFHLSRRTQGQADQHLREARQIFQETYIDQHLSEKR
ncbi:MAG: MBL fold metallo-hydrolase [Candidatus Eremiobacteraeota bacterium]|nr:MBL fold metallo-hydrolase [Candidatus Eremiobacteraeota bacterium]MCW5870798.1 MBL fold metallo-hydrolase [Candidatus Eremiobacteraeota bacterium]